MVTFSRCLHLSIFGLDLRSLRHLVQCLELGLAEGIAQFFRKKNRAKFKVFPVCRAQGIILLEHPQTFINFGAGMWITFIYHGLMGIGSGFPLIAYLGFPVFHMFQEFVSHGGADRGADGVVETVFTKQQCDAFAFEKDFCKSGTVFAGKTPKTNGLNLADTVVRMMNAIALGYGDKLSPLGVNWCR